MAIIQQIRKKLTQEFAPMRLDVIDESHLHKGHPGSKAGSGTHFRIVLVCAQFEGLSRLARQRLIHTCLARELATQIHAVTIITKTPFEYEKMAK